MTMTQVLYALAVARHHNFSKAADSLFVSQPALSLQIKNLEEELGYRLFVRTTHGVALTELGERFCRAARPLAENWEAFRQEIQAPEHSGCRRLRVGMGARVYSNGLFEEVVRFFDAHPGIEAAFVTEAGQDFLEGLRTGTLDVALDRMPPKPLVPEPERFFTCDLIGERQCILMSRSDPRSGQKEITFQELQGCTMVTGLENSMEDRILKQECRDYGITLNRIYRSDGMDTNMNLVRSGKCVVIGPRSFAEYYQVAAVPLVPADQVHLKLICLQKNAGRPELVRFRQHLLKVCRRRTEA